MLLKARKVTILADFARFVAYNILAVKLHCSCSLTDFQPLAVLRSQLIYQLLDTNDGAHLARCSFVRFDCQMTLFGDSGLTLTGAQSKTRFEVIFPRLNCVFPNFPVELVIPSASFARRTIWKQRQPAWQNRAIVDAFQREALAVKGRSTGT